MTHLSFAKITEFTEILPETLPCAAPGLSPFFTNVQNTTNYRSIERKFIHLRYQNNSKIVVYIGDVYSYAKI